MTADSYGFQVEMTHLAKRAGATVLELPIHFSERRQGTSKMSAHTVWEAFVVVGALGIARAARSTRGVATGANWDSGSREVRAVRDDASQEEGRS